MNDPGGIECFLPDEIKHPLVLSVPHSGTYIPETISVKMNEALIGELDDTDWYVDRLYSFARELNIPIIIARNHRWVADLNRYPGGAELYHDGRLITGLVPVTDFRGINLYREEHVPGEEEIRERIRNYFNPYHKKLKEILDMVHSGFGKVLLWDAHSIRRKVPSIHSEPFADFIIGTQSGETCLDSIEDMVNSKITGHGYNCEWNSVFKGGYITRYYGQKESRRYSIQLEMCKDLYMDQEERDYSEKKADTISKMLKEIFLNCSRIIQESKNL